MPILLAARAAVVVIDVETGVVFGSAVEPVEISRSFCFSATATSMVSTAPVKASSALANSTFSASLQGDTVRASTALRMSMIPARRGVDEGLT